MKSVWKIAEPCPVEFTQEVRATSDVFAQLLWNRGIRSREEAELFLSPSWEKQVHPSDQFRHMSATIQRIFTALEQGERITVHGDYDADGVTGSTVIISTLREIGRHLSLDPTLIDFYIPHRDKEGYGLHRETVPKLVERGTRLIITVDCGISCVDEIAFAQEQSIDTIVVDHHQFGETLPDGLLIHPGLPEETYPFKKLAAVGVAFKLACSLLKEARQRGIPIQEGWEKWLLDLVAIATVTDVVPLVGENRALEYFGLKVLNKTRRPGLRALIESAGLEFGKMDTESIGFAIGPRLNAAGRMDHASLALRLLLAETDQEASGLAFELERCNRERQDVSRQMMEQAEERWSTRDQSSPVIIVWDREWSPALAGLVAGRFMEKYTKPVVVIGQHAGKWIGSGRSLSTYDITQAMKTAGEGILTRVGGHIQACGFSLEKEELLSVLAERLVAHANNTTRPEDWIPTRQVDAEISLASIDIPFVEHIDLLAPFGEGNRRPTFVSRGCTVVSADTMGAKKDHLRLQVLAPSGRRVKMLGFKQGDRLSEIGSGARIDLAYTLSINEWNGRRDAEGRLVDFTQTVA